MLDNIVRQKIEDIKTQKQQNPLGCWEERIIPGQRSFEKALRVSTWSLIAECKLASPAKGRLSYRYGVEELSDIYASNGATALSVLTDRHFDGTTNDLERVRQRVALPILRKDFIVDSYQIYEARAIGADAILLIAAILTDQQLREFYSLAQSLGMDSIMEVHSRYELQRVLQVDPVIIGINNRDLTNFQTDIQTTVSLLPYCGDCMVISESGIRSNEDTSRLQQAGVKGVLVGEGLVTAVNIGGKTRELAHLP